MTRHITAPAWLALLLAAGCSGGDRTTRSEAANDVAANFVPPPMATPKPLLGQAHQRSLSDYVGKYPRDPVNGVIFYDRSEVAAGLDHAVGDAAVRQAMMEGAGVSGPIFRDPKGRVAAWGCEAHNCGDHNWTVFISGDPRDSIACYHDARTMRETSRWYAGDAPATRPGGCPSDSSNDPQ